MVRFSAMNLNGREINEWKSKLKSQSEAGFGL
jgi:hypothetical protein